MARIQENVALTIVIPDPTKPIKTANSSQKDVRMLKNSLNFVKCDKKKTPALINTPMIYHSTATLLFKSYLQQYSAEAYIIHQKVIMNPNITVSTRVNPPGAVWRGALWRMQRWTTSGGREAAMNSIREYIKLRKKPTCVYVISPVY